MPPEENEVVDRGDEVIESTEEAKQPEADSADSKAEVEETTQAASAEAEEEEVEDKKEPMLPKSRYDSVAAKNRELEAKIAELENAGQQKAAEQAKAKQVDDMEGHIADLDKQFADAVKDGDDEAMARIRKEQRDAEREMYRIEMRETGQKSSETAREQVRLDLTIDAIEENYPQLNPELDSYDEQLVDEIQELRTGFEATGRYTPTQALIKAVKTLVPEPQVASDTSAPKDTKDIDTKLDVAKKQPPDLDGVGDPGNTGGMTSSDPDPTQMSQEDLEALPESTLKRLRGDVF